MGLDSYSSMVVNRKRKNGSVAFFVFSTKRQSFFFQQHRNRRYRGKTEETSRASVGFSSVFANTPKEQNVGFRLGKTENKRPNQPFFGFQFTTLFASGFHPARIRQQLLRP